MDKKVDFRGFDRRKGIGLWYRDAGKISNFRGFGLRFDLILIPTKLLGLYGIVYNSKHCDFIW